MAFKLGQHLDRAVRGIILLLEKLKAFLQRKMEELVVLYCYFNGDYRDALQKPVVHHVVKRNI
jgi:hypothetical protein